MTYDKMKDFLSLLNWSDSSSIFPVYILLSCHCKESQKCAFIIYCYESYSKGELVESFCRCMHRQKFHRRLLSLFALLFRLRYFNTYIDTKCLSCRLYKNSWFTDHLMTVCTNTNALTRIITGNPGSLARRLVRYWFHNMSKYREHMGRSLLENGNKNR